MAEGAFRLVATIAALHHALTQRLASLPAASARRGAELKRRRDGLVYPGFFSATPWAQLTHVPRYLSALDRRLVKFAENPGSRRPTRGNRRRRGGRVIASASTPTGRPDASNPGSTSFRWLLEELQVSLFAQELKTPFPVSYRRLEKAWAELSR